MPSPRQELLSLLAAKSFRLGEFKLSSGATSDYYVDCRTTTLHPRGAKLAGMVFLEEITDGWYAVTNTRLRVGFAVRYPADLFKQLWYWQVYRGGRDYPWWSATYNVALEPCATLPVLSHAAARGEALRLAAGESREFELLAVAFEGLERVSGVSAEGLVSR